jgi:hypothetical protein
MGGVLLRCRSGIEPAATGVTFEQFPQRDLIAVAVHQFRCLQHEPAVVGPVTSPDERDFFGRRGARSFLPRLSIEWNGEGDGRRHVFFSGAARNEKRPEGNGYFEHEAWEQLTEIDPLHRTCGVFEYPDSQPEGILTNCS